VVSALFSGGSSRRLTWLADDYPGLSGEMQFPGRREGMSDEGEIGWEEMTTSELEELAGELGINLPPEKLRELLAVAWNVEDLESLQEALQSLGDKH
jgi:hypothetical protein